VSLVACRLIRELTLVDEAAGRSGMVKFT
jgi:hypothetical protein